MTPPAPTPPVRPTRPTSPLRPTPSTPATPPADPAAASQPIKTAIIDDHEAIRVGMGHALAGARGVQFVGGTETVEGFLDGDYADVDVVLLDLQLGDGSDPKDNAETLRAEGFRVLVYSIADNVRLLRRALAGGADGVCRKADPISETVDAIVAVHSGQQVISQEILSAIEGDATYVAAALGPREREVLSLYAAGLEIPEIGRTLYITENSVKEYLKRIRAKYTQVDRPAASKLELFRRAVEDGIVPPVEPQV
ncbi:LuxR C-terminal-related transcriptional regulator [Propioniciclava soli]|uniref:LuxR C-terminal-related transcriptional regulator n=1 Tax=Propioniciclava soli TaxID=2775081 RepID=UPI001E561A98|nr:response regulator transcription factor [Propioniciclava soli]